MLWYLLIGLLPLAAAVYVVWAHKKRAAARLAESNRRFEQLFGASQRGAAAPAAAATGAAVPAAVRPGLAPLAVVRNAPVYVRRERLLDPRHALLYSVLADGLPNCRIHVHVSLSALIGIPAEVQGRERDQRTRVLAQHVVDCVVCGPDTEVLAAVDLDAGDSPEARIKAECLRAVQVRHVRLDPSALPEGNRLREAVLGGAR